jgi:hypothetical protein
MRCLNRIAVRFSRTVARLAAVNVILARKNDFRVAGLLILYGFVLVTISAGLDSGRFCAKLPLAKQVAKAIARSDTRRQTGIQFTLPVNSNGII